MPLAPCSGRLARIRSSLLQGNDALRCKVEVDLDHTDMTKALIVGLPDAAVRPIKGALALASMARATGAKAAIVPAENAAEAAVVAGIEVYGVRTLAEVVGLLTGKLEIEPHPPLDVAGVLRQTEAPIDFADVRGQESVKRAITISASGAHNLLGLWPTGGDGGGRERGVPCRAVGHNRLLL